MKSYREFKQLNLAAVDKEILAYWKEHNVFERSITERSEAEPFVFFEGPPSVNGRPGIHHVMGRTIKDVYCRYQSLKGRPVSRKAGWDTHGLPIELAVEKTLGIKKDDIGKTISVEDYNKKCREEAMKYIDIWHDITDKMGYWVDMDDPYITYENNYVESLWALLKRLYDKDLLYKGYTIQPFSPAAGTGLSSHELNQPGTYREVKDTSAVAQFKLIQSEANASFFERSRFDEVFIIAWTTTPWTLPSNTALAVGKNVTYVQVDTYNPYTFQPISVILAKELLGKWFKAENAELSFEDYETGSKKIPYEVIAEFKGTDLVDFRYEQLLPYVQPETGDAFKVILGDFVTTEDGTGIVHIAPSFGADDMRVAKQQGIGALTLVNRQGRFVEEVTDFAGRPVKNYDDVPAKEYRSVDVDICIKLKTENRAFDVKKYAHSYPHCWRTDTPIFYYPLDSWFIKTTAAKDRMVELNKTINWKPKATGEGRFGNWLENLVDWNLSRSRFWGTPLPVWRTRTGAEVEEELCIGSIAELRAEVDKAVAAGFMDAPLGEDLDLHRPYVDNIFLVSPKGEKMYRESDLIDVWFDSGAMPYAQWHFPIENEETFKANYPADFIAEGVDQTRGWFFTLHALAVMLFDSIAYKSVVSNGLVLDKNGVKMSKRLGNVIDPFKAIEEEGADAIRWYIMSNSAPWDNLRYSEDGVVEVKRKFFGTLYNTYSFFALYANVDGFTFKEDRIPVAERPEIDRWVISLLNSLIKEVDALYADYEATRAARLIQDFVCDHLSNWYVRLCRRRFWKGEYAKDKIAAYQTLFECLDAVVKMASPISPFFTDQIFQALHEVSGDLNGSSVHLVDFPSANEAEIDAALEERMRLAQDISSMVLSLRKRVNIKVRQPLQKILVPILKAEDQAYVESVKPLILGETNVKEIEYISDTSGIISKSIKPDFKKLGRKLGRHMGTVKQRLEAFSQEEINQFEQDGQFSLDIDGTSVELLLDEVIINSEDIEGWLVNSMNGRTVALDIQITNELAQEGFARELVNRLQRLRKDSGLNVTDRVKLSIVSPSTDEGIAAIKQFDEYIRKEVLADDLQLVNSLKDATEVDVNGDMLQLELEKV